MHRGCVTWTVLMGVWTGLAGVCALGAEPIRSSPLPVSRQAWSSGAARMVSDSPRGSDRLRSEEFARDDRPSPQFTESDVTREGYFDEEFLPPASVRPGLSRGRGTKSSSWIDEGIVEDFGPAARTAGLPRRSPACAQRCPPRTRAVRVRNCTTSRPVFGEDECAGAPIPIPTPACRCTRCRQLPKGCRCGAKRPVCPPDRSCSPRLHAGLAQAYDTLGEARSTPGGDEFTARWTESQPFPSQGSPEFPVPIRANAKVRQSPATPRPSQSRLPMHPAPPLRPVAISPRSRYEPLFVEEPDIGPELSLPE